MLSLSEFKNKDEEMDKRQFFHLKEYAKRQSIFFREDVDLKDYSHFKTGGIIKLLVEPRTIDEVQVIVGYLCESEIEYKIIGATSNLMFLDDRIYGIFISLRNMNRMYYEPQDKVVTVEAGTDLRWFARQLLLWNITGFEGLEGIPGTLGGAVYMNAGAYDYEIRDHLLKVDLVPPSGKTITLDSDNLNFSYRHSIFMEENMGVICKIYFRAEEDCEDSIYRRMELFHAKRHKYQEFIYPTLGSMFSTEGKSIYECLAERDWKYRIMLKVVRKYYSKKLHRETPMNKRLLNRFTAWYFKLKYERQPFSDKTLNCLVNNNATTDAILDFINTMQGLLGPNVRLENEIVRDCIYTTKEKGQHENRDIDIS